MKNVRDKCAIRALLTKWVPSDSETQWCQVPPHYGLFLPEGLLTAAIMPPVFEMSINGITPCPLPLHTVRVQFIGVTREAAIRSFPWLFRIPWNEMAMGGCPFCWWWEPEDSCFGLTNGRLGPPWCTPSEASLGQSPEGLHVCSLQQKAPHRLPRLYQFPLCPYHIGGSVSLVF